VDKIIVVMMAIVFVLVAGAGLSLLLAFPFMWTWNFAMPHVFKLPEINWGQAWCLMYLLTHIKASFSSTSSK